MADQATRHFMKTGRMSGKQAAEIRRKIGFGKKKPKPKPPKEQGPQFRTLPGKPEGRPPKRKPPKKPKRPPLRQASFIHYNLMRDAVRAKGQG